MVKISTRTKFQRAAGVRSAGLRKRKCFCETMLCRLCVAAAAAKSARISWPRWQMVCTASSCTVSTISTREKYETLTPGLVPRPRICKGMLAAANSSGPLPQSPRAQHGHPPFVCFGRQTLTVHYHDFVHPNFYQGFSHSGSFRPIVPSFNNHCVQTFELTRVGRVLSVGIWPVLACA